MSDKKTIRNSVPFELDLSALLIADNKIPLHTKVTERTKDIIESIASLHGKSQGYILDNVAETLFKASIGVSFDEWVRLNRPSIEKDRNGKVTFVK